MKSFVCQESYHFMRLILRILGWSQDYVDTDSRFTTYFLTARIEETMFGGSQYWYEEPLEFNGIAAQLSDEEESI